MGLDGAAKMFREALNGKHGAVVKESLTIVRKRFAPDENVEGYRKDGPIAVVRPEPALGQADINKPVLKSSLVRRGSLT